MQNFIRSLRERLAVSEGKKFLPNCCTMSVMASVGLDDCSIRRLRNNKSLREVLGRDETAKNLPRRSALENGSVDFIVRSAFFVDSALIIRISRISKRARM